MNTPLSDLLDDMVTVLRNKVLTQVGDEATRGQIFAVIFMLNTLKLRADWAAAPLVALIGIQDQAFGELRPLLPAAAAAMLPPTPRVVQALPTGVELLALHDRGDALLSRLLPHGRTGTHSAEVEQVLQKYLRAAIDLESKHYSAKPMMAEMSSGREAS
jgi:hypothetical protein